VPVLNYLLSVMGLDHMMLVGSLQLSSHFHADSAEHGENRDSIRKETSRPHHSLITSHHHPLLITLYSQTRLSPVPFLTHHHRHQKGEQGEKRNLPTRRGRETGTFILSINAFSPHPTTHSLTLSSLSPDDNEIKIISLIKY